MKKLLSLFLALVMVLTLVPCTVFAVPESKLPTTGTYLLTIVNDSPIPAEYSVTVGEITETKLLLPKASETNVNQWVIGIEDGDTYSVSVEYPDYYGVKGATCTFSSNGEELTQLDAETQPWTQKVGETVKVEKNTLYTLSTKTDLSTGKDVPDFAGEKTPHGAVTDTGKVYAYTSANTTTYRSAWGVDTQHAIWDTFGKAVAGTPAASAGTIKFTLWFCDKSGKVANANVNSLKDIFKDSKYGFNNVDKGYNERTAHNRNIAYSASLSGTDVKVEVTYGLQNNNSIGYSFESDTTYNDSSLNNAAGQTVRKNRVNQVLKIFEEDIKNILKNYRDANGNELYGGWESFTFDSGSWYAQNASGNKAGFGSSSPKSDSFFFYQLVEHDEETVSPAAGDITLTYSIPDTVSAAVDVPLDLLNAERYAALSAINDEYIDRVLAGLKASGKSAQELLDEDPGKLLDIIGLDTLEAAFGTDMMPAASTVTLTEIKDGNEFYTGNEYTLYATATDLVKPLFASATIDLPETIQKTKTMIPSLLDQLFDMLYANGKQSKINTYKDKQSELEGKTPGVLASLTDLELKSYATQRTNNYKKNAGKHISTAESKLKEFSGTFADTVQPLLDILMGTEGIPLPIRLGYTYNFEDVRPGKYLVTIDTPDGWSREAAKQIAIVVNADGTVEGLETETTAGLVTKQALVLDVLKEKNGSFPKSTLDRIFYQINGKEDKSSLSTAYTAVKTFLYKEDEEGKLIPPTFLVNTGIWLEHDSAISAVGPNTTLKNSVEFTSVMPDGKQALPGATYMLINRDQLLNLIDALAELGEDVASSIPDMPDSLSIDALKEFYAKISSGDVEIDQENLYAVIQAGQKLSNIDMPIILKATADSDGRVYFDESSIAAANSLFGTAQYAGNTVIKQLKNVVEILDGINETNKGWQAKTDAVRKAISDKKAEITASWNKFVSGIKAGFQKIFGGFVKTANAIELPKIDTPVGEISGETLSLLIDKIADGDTLKVISDLIGTVKSVSTLSSALSEIGEAMTNAEKELSGWENYIKKPTKPGPTPPDDPEEQTKIEELMEKITELVDEDLEPVKKILGALLAHDVDHVAYAALDVLGLENGKFPNGDYILAEISAPAGYTRSNVCYTLHIENGVTTAQRGVIAPILMEKDIGFETLLAKYPSAIGSLAKLEKSANSSLKGVTAVWNGMNGFFLTKGLSEALKEEYIGGIAGKIYSRMPTDYYQSADEVAAVITEELDELKTTPTVDDLLKIADELLLGTNETVNKNWKFRNIKEAVEEQVPA